MQGLEGAWSGHVGKTDVRAPIDNLFDKHYELAYTYNTPRRSAFITIGSQEQ